MAQLINLDHASVLGRPACSQDRGARSIRRARCRGRHHDHVRGHRLGQRRRNESGRERGRGPEPRPSITAPPAAIPPTAEVAACGSTGGRVAAVVIGGVLVLGFAGPRRRAGGTALWADLTQRDGAMSQRTSISSPPPIEAPRPESTILGSVVRLAVLAEPAGKICATPANSASALFVGRPLEGRRPTCTRSQPQHHFRLLREIPRPSAAACPDRGPDATLLGRCRPAMEHGRSRGIRTAGRGPSS